MKIELRYSRKIKIPNSFTDPDPEEAISAQRQAEREAHIAALKARKAELEREIDVLKCKLGVTDWLCYLPRKAGGPTFMQRALKYLSDMRTRLQSEGTKLWLCKDHDCATRVFEISEFREAGGELFCSGTWTDRKYRAHFRGVSHDNIAFAGDLDLITEIHTPANCLSMNDMPEHVQAAAQSPQVRGLVGAACLDIEPAYAVTPIYRLRRSKNTGREWLSPET